MDTVYNSTDYTACALVVSSHTKPWFQEQPWVRVPFPEGQAPVETDL